MFIVHMAHSIGIIVAESIIEVYAENFGLDYSFRMDRFMEKEHKNGMACEDMSNK